MASSRSGYDDGFALAGRMSDRREASRPLSVRLVEVTHNGTTSFARCRDLSDTGMELDLSVPLKCSAHVAVALSPSVVLRGTVAWIDGRQCGVTFDSRVDSAALLDATALHPLVTPMQATIAVLGGRYATAARSSAPRSSEARRRDRFQPGLAVTVMVGPNREQRGLVRWTKGEDAALELESASADAPPPRQALLPAPGKP